MVLTYNLINIVYSRKYISRLLCRERMKKKNLNMFVFQLFQNEPATNLAVGMYGREKQHIIIILNNR